MSQANQVLSKKLAQFIADADTLLAGKRRDTRTMSERIGFRSDEYVAALKANAAALDTPERRAEQEQRAKLRHEARQQLDGMRDTLPAELERAGCDSGPVFRVFAAIECPNPPNLPDGFSWPLEKAALQAAAVKLQAGKTTDSLTIDGFRAAEYDGWAAAAVIHYEHGVGRSDISRAATAKEIRTRPAPEWWPKHEKERPRKLYYMPDVKRHFKL